ncbi:blastopia polyprotein [Trichonephila clavipes]|nr:blastopia polyprotein [Trichonephila clavipes]
MQAPLGFGAVLLQKSDDGLFHPIHYFSRKTTVQQEKYSSYELEVLAIIEALKSLEVTYKGSAFTSTEFQKFCQEESIEHVQITTGVPRGNSQIEQDLQIKHLLEDELSEQFINKRETLRNEAKENILRLQAENKKQYNKHRKPAYNYKPGDTVAIQRTQFGTGLKLRPKYFGPYEVTKVNKHDRYEVQKIDNMKVQM